MAESLYGSSAHRPTSPTFSEATTRASQFDLDGKIITRKDLRTSIETYETVRTIETCHYDSDRGLIDDSWFDKTVPPFAGNPVDVYVN
jgi:hypothetical protein